MVRTKINTAPHSKIRRMEQCIVFHCPIIGCETFWKGKSTKKIDDVISEYMKRIKEMKPAIIRHLLTDHSPEQLAEKLWEQVHWNLRRAMAEVEE